MNLVFRFRRALAFIPELVAQQRNTTAPLNEVETGVVYGKIFPLLPTGAVHLLVLVSLEEQRLNYTELSGTFSLSDIIGGVVEMGLSVGENVADTYVEAVLGHLYPKLTPDTVGLLLKIYRMTRQLNALEIENRVRVMLRDQVYENDLDAIILAAKLSPAYVKQWVYDGIDLNVTTEEKKRLREAAAELDHEI